MKRDISARKGLARMIRNLMFTAAFVVAAGLVWAANNEWMGLGPKNGSITVLTIDPQNQKMMYAGTTAGGLFKSTDGGASWTALNSAYGVHHVSALAISPKNPNILFAGTDNGVYKSIDAGNNWNPFTSGLTNLDITAVAIDPHNPNTIYAGTWGDGVFKSADAGLKWAPANEGLNSAFVYSLAIDSQNPTRVYAGTNNGLLTSGNAGKSWSAVKPDLGTVQALWVDPHNSNVIIAGSNSWVAGKDYTPSVWKSSDRGESWKEMKSGLPQKRLCALVIDPDDGNVMYVATEGGIFKSTDGGASWNAANSGLTAPSVSALTADPRNPSKLYAGTSGGVFEITFAR